jgi:hypothetical protein
MKLKGLLQTLQGGQDMKIEWGEKIRNLGTRTERKRSLWIVKRFMHTHKLNINALSRIRSHDPGFQASEDSIYLRPLGYRDRRRNI